MRGEGFRVASQAPLYSNRCLVLGINSTATKSFHEFDSEANEKLSINFSADDVQEIRV